jgi:hypothetical protein
MSGYYSHNLLPVLRKQTSTGNSAELTLEPYRTALSTACNFAPWRERRILHIEWRVLHSATVRGHLDWAQCTTPKLIPLAGVPKSRTSPMRFISAPVLCSGVCKTKDPASRSVLEGARRQLARRYVNNSALELNETAYLLG